MEYCLEWQPDIVKILAFWGWLSDLRVSGTELAVYFLVWRQEGVFVGRRSGTGPGELS